VCSSDLTAQKIDHIQSFDQIKSKSFTKMFWVVWDDLIVNDNFNFDYTATKWDDMYPHVFKNGDYFDGICLFPKNLKISNREFENRFFINKKEVDIQASMPKLFDIVFISYDESNAEDNYQRLLLKFPDAKRVHKVKGIHQAHIAAAKISNTRMFWVVDGDAVVEDKFNFNYQVPVYESDIMHVWRCKNPINELIYGYGGVKLLPRKLALEMDINTTDMTTSISKKFKVVDEISNITAFNTDPFNTWKSAFRECVKLSSRIIDRQKEEQTIDRLTVWCSVGKDKSFGEYAIHGAQAGKLYGEENKLNKEAIKKINDFEWLEQKFKEYYE
jgi:hypothetical protein